MNMYMNMKKNLPLIFVIFVMIFSPLSFCWAHSSFPLGPGPRLNQIQVLGTHNSYKKALDPVLFNVIKGLNKKWALELEYSHIPLTEQLNSKMIHQLELDIYDEILHDYFSNLRNLNSR